MREKKIMKQEHINKKELFFILRVVRREGGIFCFRKLLFSGPTFLFELTL
jgi:hypothetical protein